MSRRKTSRSEQLSAANGERSDLTLQPARLLKEAVVMFDQAL